LFAYDNNTFIAESYSPDEMDVKISVTGNFEHLKNLVTGEILTGAVPIEHSRWHRDDGAERRISFTVHLMPHSYEAFEMEK
jgi:hypothetical protein